MIKRLLRFALGVLVAFTGYAIIVGGTTLTFTVWLHGSFGSSAPLRTIALGTAGAALSGLCGGYVAALLGGRDPLRHSAGVLAFIALDTAYVVAFLPSRDPLWFDLFGSLTLAGATLLGGLLRRYYRGERPPATIPQAPAPRSSR